MLFLATWAYLLMLFFFAWSALMISYLDGQVLFVEGSIAVIKTFGVGYHVHLGKSDLEELHDGQKIELYIHTHVREDAFELFGFRSRIDRQIFLLLLSVSGIGPKLALGILSGLSAYDLLAAIGSNDISKLCKIPGIGKKTAERMVLELKDKVSKIPVSISPHASIRTSLEQAIKGLGYNKSQSDKALFLLEPKDMDLPFEELIKKTINLLLGKT
jgi:Holliday junction DNA helicase RuvA